MNFDPKDFSNSPYVKGVDKPWGYEILHVSANARLFSVSPWESWFIIKGQGKVIWDNNKGELIETELQKGVGYSCAIGQRHRLAGITDCDILEVSTPEQRKKERREA